MFKAVLDAIICIVLLPIAFICNPRGVIGLYKVEVHRTGIKYTESNHRRLAELLDQESSIETFVDKNYVLNHYMEEVEMQGFYGGTANIKHIEIWFKTSEDKLAWILKYPNKFDLEKALNKVVVRYEK